MVARKSLAILVIVVVAIIGGFVLFGLPYGNLGTTSANAYDVTWGCPHSDKIAVIGTATGVYDKAGGNLIVVNGQTITLAPGATFFMYGAPVTVNGQAWQKICIGSYPWIPLSAVSQIK